MNAANPPPEFTGNMPRSQETLKAWGRQAQEPALEPDLPIIDSHHHVWDDHERGRYLADEFMDDIASGHNVVASVFVQVKAMYRAQGPEAMKPVGEVEFANGVAAAGASGRYGNTRLCAAIVGHADLLLGDAVAPVLDALVAAGNGRLRGIRHGATWDAGRAGYGRSFAPRHMLLDPQFRKGFARLAGHGLTFDAWLFQPQLPDLVDLLKAFPGTPVVLDHVGGVLGLPPHVNRAEVFEAWRASIRALARFPNLSVKLGGLGMLYCGWDFHTRAMPPSSQDLAQAWRPYIETCIEAFGPGRCMFESNFPVDRQSCSYGTLWNAFKRITQGCPDDDKSALYHRTAASFYRIHL